MTSATNSVLVVDDDENVRAITEMSLRLYGNCEVVLASSGEQAIELAAKNRFAAVFLDVMMPGLDGPATLAELRRLDVFADTPVVFLTAKAQESEREELLALGVAGVITKPFDPHQLVKTACRLIKHLS